MFRCIMKVGELSFVSKRFVRSVHNYSVPGLVCYNSTSKVKSELFTGEPGILNWYTCGPTVYESSHIGHAWCYVHLDIIRRIFEKYFNLMVIQVMNITDIDDKIIKKAKEKNASIKEITSKYESEFLTDMEKLNVQRPSIIMRVSDYIPAINSFIETLLAKNMAYVAPDGSVNFSLSSYKNKYNYGKLKPASDEHTEGSSDFALWKASKTADEPGWHPTWGGERGRPGWHIECSAMASHAFGSTLDLHSGGVDLKFPHHENEEAQCCAFFEKDSWVGHWLHIGHIKLLDGTKMSKSLNNCILIKDFLNSYSADHLRMLCLISNYRKDIHFSEETLLLAKTVLDSVSHFVERCGEIAKEPSACPDVDIAMLLSTLHQTKNTIVKCLGDDFNTAQATTAVRKLISITNKELQKPTREFVIGDGSAVQAIIAVSSFVNNYFTSLGIKNLTKTAEFSSSWASASFLDEAISFRKEVRKIALEIDASKTAPPGSKKTKQALLQATDKLREIVKAHGIQLKDG